MARQVGFQGFLCAAIAVAWALNGRPSLAEPLRLVTDSYLGSGANLNDDKAPGFDVEVFRQVFAAVGQVASFESLPTNRGWKMVLRGESDGIFGVYRTNEREQICSFPDEPLAQERWVLFVRSADVGKLKFESFDDLIGHDVAVRAGVPGVFEQPTVSPELGDFLREHHNLVETNGLTMSLHMLAAGRVDYAVVSLHLGRREVAKLGLSGQIEPLLSRSVIEKGIYVCFTKGRVSPSFVEAFSEALKKFKQSEAFQALKRKYP